jgi:ATP-dependent DNA helicase PIF1
MESSIKVVKLSKHSNSDITEQPPSSEPLDVAELSPEQLIAYNKFVDGQNLFITGPGGTGKTKLVAHLISYAKSVNKNVAVCAMTGCAAVLLNCNARTLHSWSGIKLAKGTKAAVVTSVLKNKYAVKVWKKAKILILDEVSMLSQKVFEIIEEIARGTRSSSLPFGGLQVVFTGDFFQLPPVSTENELHSDKFCFESNTWLSVFKQENHIELTTMFRQTDPKYIEILGQVRIGQLNEENKQILQGYVNRQYDPANHNGCIPTKLFPLRSKVDYVNNMMFSKIKEKEHVFEVIRKKDCLVYTDSTKVIPKEVLDKCSELSQKEIDFEIDQLLGSVPCTQVLRLKKGSSVMCTVNLDMDNGICNGSQGIITNILDQGPNKPSLIIVTFSNGLVKTMSPHIWQHEDYPTLAVVQYPLCLAWALTIHKIQGATLDMAEMDIGQSIFEYGQTYVSLSRIKSLNGLYLSEFNAQKIKAHPKVVEFYERMFSGTKIE